MTPRPVIDDEEGVARMKQFTRRLRELNCALADIPPEVLEEGRLLREWARQRVLQETASLDQQAARTLDALKGTDPSTNPSPPPIKDKPMSKSRPIASDEECVRRLHATGHTFHLGAGGNVTTSHPIIPPDPEEMNQITMYLSLRWTEVMNEVRRQLASGTSSLGTPTRARTTGRRGSVLLFPSTTFTPHWFRIMPTTAPSPDAVATMSVPTLVSTARSLGFSFSSSPKGIDAVTITPPSRPGANAPLVLALARRMREPAVADMVVDAAIATGLQPTSLRSAQPPRPQKVGHDRNGKPLPMPATVPRGEPHDERPRIPSNPVGSVSPNALVSLGQCDAALAEVDQAMSVLVWSLERLPTEFDDEHLEVQHRRQFFRGQLKQLSEYAFAVGERRSELLMRHVDRTARERQLKGIDKPQLQAPGWHSGRFGDPMPHSA